MEKVCKKNNFKQNVENLSYSPCKSEGKRERERASAIKYRLICKNTILQRTEHYYFPVLGMI